MKRSFQVVALLCLVAVFASPLACKKKSSPTAPATTVQTDPAPCVSPSVMGSVATNSSLGTNTGNLIANRCSLIDGGRVIKLGIYLTRAGELRLGLYADDPVGQLPTTLIRATASQACTVGWNEIDIPDFEATSGFYWVAIQVDPAHEPAFPITGWAARSASVTGFSYAAFPSTFNANNDSITGAVFPLVAYYCAAPPTPTPTPTFTLTFTPTGSATPTHTTTLSHTPTWTFTATWTSTPSATSTHTMTSTSTFTRTATSNHTATMTSTSTPTSTITSTPTFACVATQDVFGDSRTSGSSLYANNVFLVGGKYALPIDSTVYQMKFYVLYNGQGSTRVGIYAHDAVNNSPSTLIVEGISEVVLDGAGKWYTASLPPTTLTAGTYWLAMMGRPINIGVDNGPGLPWAAGEGSTRWMGTTWGAMPSSFGGSSYTSYPGMVGVLCHP